MLGAVRAVLEQRAREVPLLVVFEDLHWADASTREVLAFLGSQPPRGRGVFGGTYRGARPEGPQGWGLVDRRSRLGGRRLRPGTRARTLPARCPHALAESPTYNFFI